MSEYKLITPLGGMDKATLLKSEDGTWRVHLYPFQSLAEKCDQEGLEGLVFYGVGGELQKWIEGIYSELKQSKIVTKPIEETFSYIIKLTTTKGRNDLVFLFRVKAHIDIGKLAIFKVGAGASWLSDYIVNYRDQFDGADSVEEDSIETRSETVEPVIGVKYPDVKVQLVGLDGNAYSIMGRAQKAARKAGLTKDQIDEYINEAISGDYNHLLAVTMEYFDCE